MSFEETKTYISSEIENICINQNNDKYFIKENTWTIRQLVLSCHPSQKRLRLGKLHLMRKKVYIIHPAPTEHVFLSIFFFTHGVCICLRSLCSKGTVFVCVCVTWWQVLAVACGVDQDVGVE